MIFSDFEMSVRKTSAKVSEKKVNHKMQLLQVVGVKITIQEATQNVVHWFK